jgi:hypothetical protein
MPVMIVTASVTAKPPNRLQFIDIGKIPLLWMLALE